MKKIEQLLPSHPHFGHKINKNISLNLYNKIKDMKKNFDKVVCEYPPAPANSCNILVFVAVGYNNDGGHPKCNRPEFVKIKLRENW
jgi:hypothetical protein